jgi:hypothetical protein
MVNLARKMSLLDRQIGSLNSYHRRQAGSGPVAIVGTLEVHDAGARQDKRLLNRQGDGCARGDCAVRVTAGGQMAVKIALVTFRVLNSGLSTDPIAAGRKREFGKRDQNSATWQ